MSEETFDLPPETTGAAAYDDSDAFTPDEFDALVSGMTHPEGDYLVTCIDATQKQPTQSEPGGETIRFSVDKALGGQVSKNGSWDSMTLNLRKYDKMAATDDERKFEGYDSKTAARLAKAMGLGQPDPDGKIRPRQALIRAAKGRKVILAVVKNKKGFMNLQNFRPVGG